MKRKRSRQRWNQRKRKIVPGKKTRREVEEEMEAIKRKRWRLRKKKMK